ncbi:hypothetical protein [Amorphus orientalis]|uniref:Uncharacterized protein n=1 Tax=Amorphus orientalis TaxID=649198 RepID=A0AAE3VLK4_9HYPH|nr:hypothetical protein [Amorphus orientalis]MDQ0314282.1 hypothetical protein [Amorphus orientalis]
MPAWTASTDATAPGASYLRLGTYQAKEERLKPEQYKEAFSTSDGDFVTTKGNWLVNADGSIDLQLKSDATILIGDFGTETDKHLTIDVLEGEKSTKTIYSPDQPPREVTTIEGKSALLKGSGTAINAVAASASAKAPAAGQLTVYASDKILISSGDMTKLHAGGNVKVTNKEASTTGTRQREFNMGFVNSIVSGMQAKIVPGAYTSAMVGLRIQIRPLDWKISGFDFSYPVTKNEIIAFKQENEGIWAFMKSLAIGVGSCVQKNEITSVKQKTMGNKTTGCGLALRAAGIKSSTVSNSTGVKNEM